MEQHVRVAEEANAGTQLLIGPVMCASLGVWLLKVRLVPLKAPASEVGTMTACDCAWGMVGAYGDEEASEHAGDDCKWFTSISSSTR